MPFISSMIWKISRKFTQHSKNNKVTETFNKVWQIGNFLVQKVGITWDKETKQNILKSLML